MAVLKEPSNSLLQNPGDVIVEDIVLRSYTGFEMNLKGLYANLHIRESIYDNCISGHIDILESYNIVKHVPIIGDETLSISFYTPAFVSDSSGNFENTTKVRLKFYVFDVSVLERTANQATNMVRLEFISKPAINSFETRISKSYMDMKLSEIVRSIWDEHLKIDTQRTPQTEYAIPDSKLNVAEEALVSLSPTMGNQSIIIPYWNPFYAINWICNRARAAANPYQCDYVFFQNMNGYNFLPISLMKSRSQKYRLTNVPHGFRNQQDGTRNLGAEMLNVIEANVMDYGKTLRQQKLGMFGSQSLSVDSMRKRWKYTTYDYEFFFKETEHLNPNPLVSMERSNHLKKPQSLFKNYCATSNLREKRPIDFEPEDVSLLRQSLLQQINAVNLRVKLHGNTNIQIGDVIYYDATSNEMTGQIEGRDDDYIIGRYLVTSIEHDITDTTHLMSVVLSKDSFVTRVPDDKERTLGIYNQPAPASLPGGVLT